MIGNENPIRPSKIDHLVLKVHDLDKMMAFYIDVLGCTIEREPGDFRLAQLRAGTSLIDLLDARSEFGLRSGSPPDGKAPNMDHFCLKVQPWNDAAILAHLDTHSVEHGPIASRNGADGQGPSLYLLDPEGNSVELKGDA
ncbi:MAG: VOC family protein [Pseudomonadota bacterium]